MKKIIIYEDNNSLRNSLELLLFTINDYNVVATFDDANTLEKDLFDFRPDLVILDIDMPGRKGTEVVPIIKKLSPQSKILMYTVFDESEKLFDCLCAGANGYVLKKSTPDKLLQYVADVLDGGTAFSPSIAEKVLLSFRRITENSYNLSDREKEVLRHLVNGYTYKGIADLLNISTNTIRKHVSSIYEKLHVSSGREAVTLAINKKIV
jgi:DNA-binding NarL/FixJ family response regulator